MEISGITQRTRMCLFGKGILCEYGRKRRKKSVCQRTVDRFQQRRNQQIVQSGCVKNGSKFRKQLRETEHQKTVDLLTVGKE